jgi:hypothetical protein
MRWPVESAGLGIAILVAAGTANADCGSIPYKRGAQVFEPTQRAMIAWNGSEEILVLSTDLRASEATKVLEVMPLPSEPKVSKADIELFRKATELINSKLPKEKAPPSRGGMGGGYAGVGGGRAPAGEITFHEKLGAHDISVSHVVDHRGFMTWVETYLKKEGVDNPVVPESMKAVAEQYIKEGFTWFVFDVVSLGEKPITKDAIQYRFRNGSLFYPVKISRTDKGPTSIDLLILTPNLLRTFPGIPLKSIERPHKPVALTHAELKGLNRDMDSLLNHRTGMRLRIWRITGDLSTFDRDLIAR